MSSSVAVRRAPAAHRSARWAEPRGLPRLFPGHAEGCGGGYGPCARPALCICVVLLLGRVSLRQRRCCTPGVWGCSVRGCQCRAKRSGTDEHGVKGAVCLSGDGEGSDRASPGTLRLEHSVNIKNPDHKFSIKLVEAREVAVCNKNAGAGWKQQQPQS